jgi:flagellar biosynthesis/type III secretory pathway M-ring protein FliF/YscJ
MVSFEMPDNPWTIIYACTLFILVILIAQFLVRKLVRESKKVEEEQRRIEERMAHYDSKEDPPSR